MATDGSRHAETTTGASGLDQQLKLPRKKEKSGATEHTGGTGSKGAVKAKREDKQVIPKPWAVLSDTERWWLRQLWSGNLFAEIRRAESKCHRVQAPDFAVNDDHWIEC